MMWHISPASLKSKISWYFLNGCCFISRLFDRFRIAAAKAVPNRLMRAHVSYVGTFVGAACHPWKKFMYMCASTDACVCSSEVRMECMQWMRACVRMESSSSIKVLGRTSWWGRRWCLPAHQNKAMTCLEETGSCQHGISVRHVHIIFHLSLTHVIVGEVACGSYIYNSFSEDPQHLYFIVESSQTKVTFRIH